MDKRRSPKIVMKIAKKLGVFCLEDVETLTGFSKVDTTWVLEKLVELKHLKYENNCYIYINKEPKIKEYNPPTDWTLEMLPFPIKKPKVMYLRRLNEIKGYANFYFAPPRVKKPIHRILTVLKEGHGAGSKKLAQILKKHNMATATYYKYRDEISQNGFDNILKKYDYEPGEIYYFFKEYYLTTKKYTEQEAWELAITRFEKMLPYNMVVDRKKISSPTQMLKRLKNEYIGQGLKKFRIADFSQFDLESIIPYEFEK
ncbi:MAG: hypothetical protein R3Y28_03440 [Candidatus Gastranaerophilales bacterium]